MSAFDFRPNMREFAFENLHTYKNGIKKKFPEKIIHLAFYILCDNIYNKYISVKLLCVSPLHYKPLGLPIEHL